MYIEASIPPTVDWYATTCILEYHSFVRFGALSPSRAVFPSASDPSLFPRFPVSSFPHFLISSFLVSRFPFPVPRFPFPISHFPFHDLRSDPRSRPCLNQQFRSPVYICNSNLPVRSSNSNLRFGSCSGSCFRLPFRFPSPSSFPFLMAAHLAASRFAPALHCFIKKAALDHRQSLG